MGLLAALAASFAVAAQPLGTAFTYQGQLTESGQAASGLYDLQVCLFDSPSNPLPIGCAPDFGDVPVEDGVFTLALDFGAAPFAGQQRYLELRVRPGASSGGYTILSPRQSVRATPEALRAAAASAAPWSGLTGVPAGFADGADNDSGGTVTSVVAGTGLSGGTITGSGTLAIAPGGVGPTQIAPGAVGPTQLAPAAVRLAQIDISQVQARISGSCAVGEYFRGINADGTVACEPVPGLASLAVVDDPPVNSVDEPSLAIGADGLPVMSYWDITDGNLKFARCVDSACRRPAQIRVLDTTGSTGRFSDIGIGSGGLPVISYVSSSTLELRLARCLDVGCAGVDLRTLDTAVEQATTAIVVPPGDLQPVVAYRRSGQLHLIRCANPDCASTQARIAVDATVGSAGALSMALGGDGLPIIAFADAANGTLRFARCANAECSSRAAVTVDDPANLVGSNNSVAVGPDGTPVIAYRDDSTSTLKYARCGNANCSSGNTVTSVSGAGSSVFQTQIAVGDDGIPTIAFIESASAAGVRILRCGNAGCTAANTLAPLVLGGANGSPGAPSMALGDDGLPVVAFRVFSATANERTLRFAKCGSRSCQ
jgi:hypothetical protein